MKQHMQKCRLVVHKVNGLINTLHVHIVLTMTTLLGSIQALKVYV